MKKVKDVPRGLVICALFLMVPMSFAKDTFGN